MDIKEEALKTQQQCTPIPIHLQTSVGTEVDESGKQGHVDENCFVSPAVNTIKQVNFAQKLPSTYSN